MLTHRKVSHLILLSFFVFISMELNCANATDIYVTPTRPAAFGNGSLATPFRSMSSAVRAAQPGDTVRLMAGVHGAGFNAASCTSNCGGVLTPPHGGTVGNPITITSYPNPLDAIIDGNGQVASCVNIRYPNIIIDGLELRNCVQMGIMADGDSYGSYDATRSSGNYGGFGERLYNNNGVDNTIIRNNYIHDCLMDAVKVTHSNNITVENNNMYNVSTTTSGHSTMQMNGIYGGVVRNNWMHDDPGNPNPHAGFFMKGGSKNIIFENNRIENMGAYFTAIEIGSDIEWYNVRYDPTVLTTLNSRILTESDADNEIKPSATGVYTNSTTYQPEVLAEAQNIIVRGNIVINCDVPFGSRNGYNVFWYNNTVINGGQSSGWYKLWTDGYNGIPGRGYNSRAHVCKNQKFYNNLVFNDTVAAKNLGSTGRAYYITDKDGDNYPLMNQEGLEMDYNQYYNMGYTQFFPNITTTVDTHALYNVNPVLDGNYRPASGNAALTSGANLRSLGILGSSETWVDRDGVTRPTADEIANGYGIGALGYIAPTTTTPPTVFVTSPANNAEISGIAGISATATGNARITKVEFYVDGVLKGSDLVSSYSCNWNTSTVANGSYTISAKAYDVDGNVGLSPSIAVTVNNIIIPDTTLPAVSLSTPANNAVISGTVSVSATASDNVGVTKVEFLEDNVLKAVMNVEPYQYNLDTTKLTEGSHTLIAKAYDAAGNVGQSAVVNVTVNNLKSDLTAPSVLLFTLPATATTLTVPITYFFAFDSVGVTGYLITESATAPAAGADGWTLPSPSSLIFSTAGVKTLYAWAKDAAGNVSTSRSATVTISIPDTIAPTVSIGVRKANVTTSGMVSVTATANDNMGVSKVEFYVNGVLASSTAIAPYVFNWDSAAAATGSNTLMARVYDAAGNIGQSASVKIFLPNVKFR